MKKRIIIMLSVIIFMLVAYASFSYALFTKSKEQEGINQITTYNCLDISINGEEELNLNNAYPIKDEEGVLQTPYTFTITNNCNHYVGVDIGVEYLEESTISPSIIKATLNKPTEGIMPQILSNYNLVQATDSETGLPTETAKYIMVHEGLPAGDSQTFEYRMWIDYSVENLSTSDKLKVKIVGIGTVQSEEEAPKNWWSAEEGTLLAALRDNNSVRKPLTTPGRQINLPTESVLASAEDDYGTSYYYRGNVENNYLVFANKCWRIVRVTGDGSIKLVLQNNSSTDCSISSNVKKTSFNNNSSSRYNAGIGFMYGIPNSDKVYTLDGDTLTGEHDNINDSTILANLKTWYKTAFIDTNLDSYLADIIWCGDKSINSGSGIGQLSTTYKSRYRLVTTRIPNLICPNYGRDGKLSKYTAYATEDNKGNGMLKTTKDGVNTYYKIGLLTVDEVQIAGNVWQGNNLKYYLYNGTTWWTISGSIYNTESKYSDIFVERRGKIDSNTCYSYAGIGLRPSIALISNIKITNTNQKGTISNPYVIDET